MPRYCSYCGSELREARDLRRFWIMPLECSSDRPHEFLEVADSRLVFPLLELGVGVMDRIRAAREPEIELAVSRIRRIDYKTVSIVGFEQTLRGCYQEQDHAVSGS